MIIQGSLEFLEGYQLPAQFKYVKYKRKYKTKGLYTINPGF